MEAKFTNEGGWLAHGLTVYSGETGIGVAYVESMYEDIPGSIMPDKVPATYEQARHNAVLMAAAPEMYELLERYFNSANGTRCEDEVQEELESCDEAWSALRERINT